MSFVAAWIRLVSLLVPAGERENWTAEWLAELAVNHGTMSHAWGVLADAWYLRTEGWTMDAMMRDLRMAVRSLVRRPFFTALAGVTLAVGIGANTAIFSVVDAVLINPLPFPQPDRVVSYNHEAPGLGVNVPVVPHSPAMYLHYLENARSLDAFAVFSQDGVNLIDDGDPQQLTASLVTSEYFDVIGVQPFLGRGFVEGEDRPGAEPVAVISFSLFEQTFGSDRSVVGRLLEMDGVQRRVVGVMPAAVTFIDEDVWLPMVIDPATASEGNLGLIGIGRLTEGATIASADTEMQDLLMRFVEASPDALSPEIVEQAGLASNVQPFKEVFVESVRQALWVVLGTVGIVLLIACANVANLFLVRAEARQREQAVRAAMGASRSDLVRQYLTEALTLAVGAGLLGLGLASFGVKGLIALAPAELPQALDIGIDGSVLAFTAVISVLSGTLFGLMPALGYGGADLSSPLRDGARGSTTGRERHRARSGLVVAQVALALVLLVGSGLMARSFVALRGVDPGFEAAGLLTFSYALPDVEYPEATQVLDFHRQLTDRLAAMPGAKGVGMINGLPLTDTKRAGPMEPVDRPVPEGELGPIIERRSVTPGYFDAMHIDVVEGRGLEWDDQADNFRAVVISNALANSFWPARSAIGQQIRGQGSENPSWNVVGVVDDVRFDGVQDEPMPIAYFPALSGTADAPDASRSFDVVVRVGGAPLDAIGGARDALSAVGPRVPMINPRTVETVVSDSLAATSFTVILLGIAAGVALLLGTVGIYGVISYLVGKRTQEIGVRMALGAPASTVLKSVVGDGLRLTGFGVALGLLGAWGLSRALGSLLYGVAATDPLTFAGTAALLTGVAALAAWIPARRASRVDPVEALRAE